MNGSKTLIVKWLRLLVDGQTCPRCGATGDEVDKAVATLSQVLAPLGIAVVLEKGGIATEEFMKDTLQSNMIWLNGRLLEEWLGAERGQSQCSEVCGTNDCRTLAVDGTVYEAIPAELVVKAGLLAAMRMLASQPCGCAPAKQPSRSDCCS
jgi:hypothetical protein